MIDMETCIKIEGTWSQKMKKCNLILYHGTNSPDEIEGRGFKKGDVNLYGDGIYLFKDKKFAKAYGKNVIRVNTVIEKPFIFTDEQLKLYSKLYQEYTEKGSSFPKKEAINEINRRYGYDSLRFTDFSKNKDGAIAWVIFNPDKIKVMDVT